MLSDVVVMSELPAKTEPFEPKRKRVKVKTGCKYGRRKR